MATYGDVPVHQGQHPDVIYELVDVVDVARKATIQVEHSGRILETYKPTVLSCSCLWRCSSSIIKDSIQELSRKKAGYTMGIELMSIKFKHISKSHII